MKKVSLLLTLVLLVTLLIGVGAAVADNNRNFRAHAKGQNQVPNPVDTQAQGQVILNFSKDGSQLHVKLNVANIENVIGAHLHKAPEGANGPIVLGFIGTAASPFISNPITKNGTLFEGDFSAADLETELAGKALEDLKAEILAGNIYVNVHTVQNRPGEIRGQLH